MKLVKIIVREL